MTKPPRKRAPPPSRASVAPIAPLENDALFERVVTILEAARARVVRAVNSEMVLAYWHIGREIVESVQGGPQRAEYGEAVLETLSSALGRRFGRGFSISNLRYFRLFYVAFADRAPEIRQPAVDESRGLGAGPAIHQSAIDESGEAPVLGPGPPALQGFSPALSWGHYRTLAKVEPTPANRPAVPYLQSSRLTPIAALRWTPPRSWRSSDHHASRRMTRGFTRASSLSTTMRSAIQWQ